MLLLCRDYFKITADGHNPSGDGSLTAAQHISFLFWVQIWVCVFCLFVVLHCAGFNKNCGLRRLREERVGLSVLDQKAVLVDVSVFNLGIKGIK